MVHQPAVVFVVAGEAGGTACAAALASAQGSARPALVLHWDKLDVPPGHASVPAWYTAHVAELRQELLAFVYDLGFAVLPGGQVQHSLKAGDSLSQWWCSLLFEKHPKVTPGIYPALKARALERMLEEVPCTVLRLFGGDAILLAALRSWCANTGKVFEHVPAGPESRKGGHAAASDVAAGKASWRQRLRDGYYALPGPLKAGLRMAVWLWQIRRHLPRTKAPCPDMPCGTIATYFPNVDVKAAAQGRFRSRYWESLHDVLAAEAGHEGCAAVNWLFVHFPSPQQSFAQCLALRDTFRREGRDGASFHYVEEFLDTKDIWLALGRYVRLAWTSFRLEKDVRPLFHFAASRMDLWGWLGPYWADSFRGWRCLERCLQRRGMLAFTAWAGVQRWTIFPMENCPWERMLTEAVHKAGHGPVYGTQHSTVRPTDFRYFDDPRSFVDAEGQGYQPDMLYGNGRGACNGMLEAGTPAQRLGMVEALRYMYLAGAARSRRWQGPAQNAALTEAPAALTEAPVALVARGRLLVVTSFFADEVEAHIAVLGRWLRQDPAAARWRVQVKPHPYLAVQPYLACHCEGAVLPEVLDTPVGDLLEAAVQAGEEEVTVVWASNSTTVALEAALMGLPVLVQLPEDDVDLCPLQGVENVARIATAEDAVQALAAPRGAALAPDYLALDPELPLWRALLGLR